MNEIAITALAVHAWLWFWIESQIGEATIGRIRDRMRAGANDLVATHIEIEQAPAAARRRYWLYDKAAYRLACSYCSAPEWIIAAWLAVAGWPTDWPLAVTSVIAAYGLHIFLAALRGVSTP